MRKICFPYKRMISMLLVLACMLGLLPTAALAADAPGSIKMEDCTHNGVHYESPSLGTCWLHQMTFDYNQKSTIGFCAEHGKGMGWSLDLGLELVRLLIDGETAEALKKKIQYDRV